MTLPQSVSHEGEWPKSKWSVQWPWPLRLCGSCGGVIGWDYYRDGCCPGGVVCKREEPAFSVEVVPVQRGAEDTEAIRAALNQAANDLHAASQAFGKHLRGTGMADDFDRRARKARSALARLDTTKGERNG